MQRDKKFVFLIICVLLGVAMALQFRTTFNNNKQKTLTSFKIEELKAQLKEEDNKNKELKQLLRDSEAKKEAHLKAIVDDKNNDYLKYQMEQLDKIKLKAALTDVKGPGIIVKLNDALARKSENPNDIIIHDIDIVKVLNELKVAGAQAIAINDDRIVPTSEQLCAGPTIRINKNRYAVPYEIKAIGDPELLYNQVEESGIVAIMREYNIRVDLSKSKEVVIQRFNNNIDNLISGLEVIEK